MVHVAIARYVRSDEIILQPLVKSIDQLRKHHRVEILAGRLFCNFVGISTVLIVNFVYILLREVLFVLILLGSRVRFVSYHDIILPQLILCIVFTFGLYTVKVTRLRFLFVLAGHERNLFRVKVGHAVHVMRSLYPFTWILNMGRLVSLVFLLLVLPFLVRNLGSSRRNLGAFRFSHHFHNRFIIYGIVTRGAF